MNKFFTITLFIFSSFLMNAQSSIAHLNSQEVMAAMPSYNKAVKDLEKFQGDLETELDVMIADYRKAMEKYIAEREGLSPVRRQFEEEKLAKKEQDINARQQSIQSEIEAYSRELNGPIVYTVELAVKIVAERRKLDYVLDKTMLMISNGTDITKEVIEEVIKLENKPLPPPKEEIKEVEVSRP